MKRKIEHTRGSDNVFADIGVSNPEQALANANRRLAQESVKIGRLLTKSALADYIAERREQLRKEYGFDPNNGTAQIDYGLMWRQAKILAYGEYDALARLADRFNLEYS